MGGGGTRALGPVVLQPEVLAVVKQAVSGGFTTGLAPGATRALAPGAEHTAAQSGA